MLNTRLSQSVVNIPQAWSSSKQSSAFESVRLARTNQIHEPAVRPDRHDPSYAIVSTFPPKACGLATFAAALHTGLRAVGVGDVDVVAVSPPSSIASDPRIIAALDPASPSSIKQVARVLNHYGVVFLQHEYGIFGGGDGRSVLDLMSQINVPIITTLHSVPLQPTEQQKLILETVVSLSSLVVTMTSVARQRLVAIYDVDGAKVATIPHGATIPQPVGPMSVVPPTLLTWGLLGPGKGIEWVLDAIAMIKDSSPMFRYVIAGQTHPNIVKSSGESYRRMLEEKVRQYGLGSMVRFDASYKTLPDLLQLINRATCVVLPYESTDQITSGVLVDAIAAGKPVVSTQFSHAVELLSDGAGFLVPPKDPVALAAALKRVVNKPKLVSKMAKSAAKLAPMHAWPTVATQYSHVAHRVMFDARREVAQ